jgi:hypothetical protein
MDAIAELPPAWKDDALDRARQEGDAVVDALAAKVLSSSDPRTASGRLGYNSLLDLADRILGAPELLMVESSTLARDYANYPAELRDYFDPQPVPAWVDEKLLARAGEVWDEHALAIIGVLYAASLPYCYLVGRGVPALYATRKLGEHRFIYQRIHETGLMLDAVMREDGVRVVRDLPRPLGDDLAEEVARIDPAGGWRWRGDRLEPDARAAQGPPAVEVLRAVRERTAQAPRFAWGAGVVAARKVRFLHASMRYFLLNPPEVPAGAPRKSSHALLAAEGAPYDRENCGLPVNQEDLAYTLLTFGHVIPRGLARWGIALTPDENEAFWHRWRFVGHLMGVREDLLPVDAGAAKALFERILARQRGASAMGQQLAGELERFLGDYLPPILAKDLPAQLIRGQLGADAELLAPGRRAPLWVRAGYAATMPVLRVANFVRRSAARFVPWGTHWLAAIAHEASQALIASWRDGYDRHPFYVPESAGAAWHRQRGATDAFEARLREWRGRLFMANVRGLAGLIVGALLIAASAIALPLPRVALILSAIAAVAIIAGILVLSVQVPALTRRRPRLEDDASILRHPR